MDDDVVGFDVRGAGVEHHVDLARHDDRIIHRAGTMHQRMLGVAPRFGTSHPPLSSWIHGELVDLGTDRWERADRR